MSIDALLYRPITQQSQFEGLIPPYQGQEISLDKESDNSTTYDTLKYMDQWATKYAYQMKKVAPRLKGRDLKETVAKIYLFLYSHFQYKLDGSLQNLYSPSAAWHFRNKGFDCKTYSILASTILRNLNIPHTFRMVQQAGIMPGQWSHVYVIVPENNTYLVIDATTHTNKEVIFTKKHDYTMIHRGLASPYPYGALGCACQGKSIKRNVGLGAPATMEKTIANFHLFLNELEKKGFPREVTDRMLLLVKSNIENGIDPNFEEIVKKAIMPQSALGEIAPVSLLNSVGSTFNMSPTASPLSIQGVNTSGIISGITGLVTGNPLAAIGLISSIIPIDKTFGQVFANGFDLSCWNSSYSEQKAKKDLELDTPFMGEWSGLNKTVSTETVNKFLAITAGYIAGTLNGQRSKYASCTRKGHALRQKTTEELRKNTMDALASSGYILQAAGSKSTSFGITAGTPGFYKGWALGPYDITYDTYNVIVPQQQFAPQVQQAAQAQQQITYQTVQNANGTTSQIPVPTDNTPVKSSSSTPLLLGGAALLALKLLI